MIRKDYHNINFKMRYNIDRSSEMVTKVCVVLVLSILLLQGASPIITTIKLKTIIASIIIIILILNLFYLHFAQVVHIYSM